MYHLWCKNWYFDMCTHWGTAKSRQYMQKMLSSWFPCLIGLFSLVLFISDKLWNMYTLFYGFKNSILINKIQIKDSWLRHLRDQEMTVHHKCKLMNSKLIHKVPPPFSTCLCFWPWAQVKANRDLELRGRRHTVAPPQDKGLLCWASSSPKSGTMEGAGIFGWWWMWWEGNPLTACEK
jgi:hypothetical protein